MPERTWDPIEHRHDFALADGSDACEIVLEDRLGARLPTVRVSVRDAEERPVRLLLRGRDGEVRLDSAPEAREGRLTVLAPDPGVLDLEIVLPGAGALGRCRVTVGSAPAGTVIPARLERSLDELRADMAARMADRAERRDD